MSDTSNLTNSNIEPSMEDILSSIRKVIADDIASEETTQLVENTENGQQATTDAEEAQGADQPAPQSSELPSTPAPEQEVDVFENILELEMLVEDTIDNLDNLEIAPPEYTPQLDIDSALMPDIVSFDEDGRVNISEELEMEDVLGPEKTIEAEAVTAPLELDFDESLDLVMDSDANDYITTGTLLPDAQVQVQAETGTEDTQVQAQYNPPIEADPVVENTDLPTEAVHVPRAVHVSEAVITMKTVDTPKIDPPTPDEDIDLVKSLLADLMDEPIEDEVEATFNTETPDRESLGTFDTDFDAIAEEEFLAEALIIPEPVEEPAVDSEDNITIRDEGLDIEPEADTTLSDIAKSAREASEAGITETDFEIQPEIQSEIQSGDIVDISQSDMISKLALLASTTPATDDNTQSDNNGEPQIESEIADLIKSIPTEDEPQLAQTDEPAQEDDAMVTPLKSKKLIDEETETDASSAFASLTSAVAEKSLLEENGPPIGELVKDALKPMLQEWLDNNLKAMVQRAVTKEIKRISSSK